MWIALVNAGGNPSGPGGTENAAGTEVYVNSANIVKYNA